MSEIDDVRMLAYTLMVLIEKRANPDCFHEATELMILRQLLDRLGELKPK